MLRSLRLSAASIVFVAGAAAAQVPPEERIPITDPDRLQALGFPRDARNVAVWSKADLGLEQADVDTPETWGGAFGYSTVNALDLVPYDQDVRLGRSQSDTICYDNDTSHGAYTYAQIHVPEGAQLKLFRSWSYDSDPNRDVKYWVWETCQPYGYEPPSTTVIAQNSTIGAIGQYPGSKSLNDLTVNNQLCNYTVLATFAESGEDCLGPALKIQKLQFTWTRQVSPAPATASFIDVPTTHPYFRFIEALKDSGITGGCSVTPALYCPNSPITRGEMAVFLAAAFGLSWP
jgi:hypothetical protein